MAACLVWFRNDLRLSDHAALTAAAESGHEVLPVYVLDEAAAGAWAPGGASRWWLHHSLAALDAKLRRLGATLILRRGSASKHLRSIASEMGAVALHGGHAVEPWARAQEAELGAALAEDGVAVHWHRTVTLFDQDELRTRSGGPFQVYSPFARTCMATGGPLPPLPAPVCLPAPERLPGSDRLEDWGLLPTHPDWAGEIRSTWTAGEAAAQDRLHRFISAALADYAAGRDRPRAEGTSRLSPHLHWGEISRHRSGTPRGRSRDGAAVSS